MKLEFEARFAKDLRAIHDKNLLNKIKETIVECQLASHLLELNQIKKMQGYDSFLSHSFRGISNRY